MWLYHAYENRGDNKQITTADSMHQTELGESSTSSNNKQNALQSPRKANHGEKQQMDNDPELGESSKRSSNKSPKQENRDGKKQLSIGHGETKHLRKDPLPKRIFNKIKAAVACSTYN